ncbi:DUF234 domain-containing protein [Streptomyces sp. NPDC049040]|uniref:DUF234 domain-containing protein n=1 Tax=Streptomyces sp. NPDC049040 TaxID=3365593 RepID=UPI0037167F58
MVAADTSLSSRPSRETRSRIDDPHLRFWLAFVGPGMPLIERGRGDRVRESLRASWTSWRGVAWRGRAVEPVLREALWRLTDEQLPEGTHTVGGYWTRTNDPEIDLALLAVARSGCTAQGVRSLTPEDLMAAWT